MCAACQSPNMPDLAPGVSELMNNEVGVSLPDYGWARLIFLLIASSLIDILRLLYNHRRYEHELPKGAIFCDTS